MNLLTIALIALRSAALALNVGGDTKTANALYTISDLVQAGKVTDAHMQEIADKLNTRDITSVDWDDVIDRIEADRTRLHGD